MQVYSDKFDFQIIVESPEVSEATDYWQKQCSVLYRELKRNLISGSIDPLTPEYEKSEKGLDIIFYILLASGITLEAFDRIYDVINIWLENIRSAKVILKHKDGSIIELTHLSKSEAIKLMEEHQRQNKE